MKQTLVQIWTLLSAEERRRALVMLLMVILMAVAETIGVISIMPFLSVLGRPEILDEQPVLQMIREQTGFSDTRSFIVALGLASMAIVVVSSIYKTVTLHLVSRFVHFQRHSMSSRLLGIYLRQPYEFFLENNSSALSKNVLSEVDHVTFELLQPLSQLIAQGAIVLAMVILVFAYDPVVAIHIIIVVTALYGLIYLLVRKRLGRIGRERHFANTQRYRACSEALGGIKDLKVTHSESAYLESFSRASRQFSRHSASAETLSHSPLYIVEAAGYSGLIGIALYLLLLSNDIAHVLPALGLYGFAAYRLLPAAQIMYRGLARLRFSSASLQTIHHDLSLPTEDVSPPASAIEPKREIKLRGIRYAYPSARSKVIFDNFDLTIPVNTSIGIAGCTGSGKSTLLDILLGLLQPQAGKVSVDDTEINRSNLAAWQKSIGYVPQHIYLADASVAENIAFGIPPDEVDPEAVLRAARIAQIHDFIVNELPAGYHTGVGERGVRLSGGQRQRIGIARALYLDPPIICLDEATSALDSATEEAVNSAIRDLSGKKTIIIVAHRERSLDACHRVITLQGN